MRDRYRVAKKDLCKAISQAKSGAWNELLQELDRNPWGLAYRIVRKKIRRWMHPITERLNCDFLERVTGILFPDPEPENAGDRSDGVPLHTEA